MCITLIPQQNMAKNNCKTVFGFTLIEVLVAISVLGLLMTALMVAFNTAVDTVQDMQQKSEMMQNIRATTEQLHRELSQAIINNNRPDGEQVYFQIKQISQFQSVLRFGCTTERGLLEVAYQIKPAYRDEEETIPDWQNFELWRLNKTERMWNYKDRTWPEITFDSEEAEPFAFGIIAFKARYWSTEKSQWIDNDWDSFQKNAMPRKIQITVMAMPRSDAKSQREALSIDQLERVESYQVEITLPQAR